MIVYCPVEVKATLAFVSVFAPLSDSTFGGFAKVTHAELRER